MSSTTTENNSAYRNALGIYFFFAAYLWYVFHSLGLFVATHYVAENPAGFSTANPNFNMFNNGVATVLCLVSMVILFANQRLKEYVVDVGDEMTRVSWAELKDTQRATLVVIALVIVAGIFLFIVDIIFMRLFNAILATAA